MLRRVNVAGACATGRTEPHVNASMPRAGSTCRIVAFASAETIAETWTAGEPGAEDRADVAVVDPIAGICHEPMASGSAAGVRPAPKAVGWGAVAGVAGARAVGVGSTGAADVAVGAGLAGGGMLEGAGMVAVSVGAGGGDGAVVVVVVVVGATVAVGAGLEARDAIRGAREVVVAVCEPVPSEAGSGIGVSPPGDGPSTTGRGGLSSGVGGAGRSSEMVPPFVVGCWLVVGRCLPLAWSAAGSVRSGGPGGTASGAVDPTSGMGCALAPGAAGSGDVGSEVPVAGGVVAAAAGVVAVAAGVVAAAAGVVAAALIAAVSAALATAGLESLLRAPLRATAGVVATGAPVGPSARGAAAFVANEPEAGGATVAPRTEAHNTIRTAVSGAGASPPTRGCFRSGRSILERQHPGVSTTGNRGPPPECLRCADPRSGRRTRDRQCRLKNKPLIGTSHRPRPVPAASRTGPP